MPWRDWLASLRGRSSVRPLRRRRVDAVGSQSAIVQPLETRVLLASPLEAAAPSTDSSTALPSDSPALVRSDLNVNGGPVDDVRINTYTTNSQSFSAIALNADGDYVITWSSSVQDGNTYGIYAQRYNTLGQAQGSEFRVNTYTTSQQHVPAVAMDADGDYVITWNSYAQDGSNTGIYAQRYNALGVAQGNEFRVNTYTTNAQSTPAVAMDADGDFVVTWQSNAQDGSSYGVYAQRYNALGQVQGSEFQVNTYITGDQRFASVAMDADGDFVVTWTSSTQDGSDTGIYARRYNALGQAQGSEFRVNTYTTFAQRTSAVAMDADGDFVVTWTSSTQDGSNYGIYAQRYNALGQAQGSEFRVNTYTTSQQTSPAVAMDADGDFVVTWNSSTQDAATTASTPSGMTPWGKPRGVSSSSISTPRTHKALPRWRSTPTATL